MVKNWMVLGDEAFDGNDIPVGVVRFSPTELSNWKDASRGDCLLGQHPALC